MPIAAKGCSHILHCRKFIWHGLWETISSRCISLFRDEYLPPPVHVWQYDMIEASPADTLFPVTRLLHWSLPQASTKGYNPLINEETTMSDTTSIFHSHIVTVAHNILTLYPALSWVWRDPKLCLGIWVRGGWPQKRLWSNKRGYRFRKKCILSYPSSCAITTRSLGKRKTANQRFNTYK